jgi:hypothetical protein
MSGIRGSHAALGVVCPALFAAAGCTLLLPYPPPPNSCDAPLDVVGIEGSPTVIDFDTRFGTGSAPVFCGSAMVRPPQFIIAYTVPGEGPRDLSLSTVNDETPRTFDTLLLVRRGACRAESDVNDACFDDGADGDHRSAGHYLAQGGETVTIIVTGYALADRGTGRLVIESRATHPPHLEAASVWSLPDTSLLVSITGSDEDGDLTQAQLTLHASDGTLLDVNGDGAADPATDTLSASLVPPPTSTGTTTASGRVPTILHVLPSGALARVQALDALGNASAEIIEVTSVAAEIAGSGEACGGVRICDDGLECASGTCGVASAWARACAMARPVTLEVGTPLDLIGSIPPLTSAITTFECMTHSNGPEDVLAVSLPAGRFDLLASTNAPGTAQTDTVLYALARCDDPVSFLGCNDDVLSGGGTTFTSAITILEAPAALAIVVDTYATGPTAQPYELTLTLRPVLDPGAACDWMEERDRCASGHCDASSNVCPP